MGVAVAKGATKTAGVLAMLNDDTIDQVTRNAIIAATSKTNQQAVEDYVKKTTSLSNLQEKMAKAVANELTMDEYRELFETFPEIFSNAEKVEQFKHGMLNLDKEQAEINDKLTEDLELQLKIAINEVERLEDKRSELKKIGEDLTTNEENQIKNYKAQIELINIQLDQAKYAVLYSTEM